MIDYEKLRLAHELCTKTTNYFIRLELGIEEGIGDIELFDISSNEIEYFKSLDDLITKLKELTQSQPKYKEGEEVWFVGHNRQILTLVISAIEKDIDGYIYADLNGNAFEWLEHELYPSRQALIESQIEYWQGLLPDSEMKPLFEGEIKSFNCAKAIRDHHELVCQHESDGKIYAPYPPMLDYKCKKCGEYYK